jgi:hypothetical protein
MLKPGGGIFPWDRRYVAFNYWIDHNDTSTNSATRQHRIQPISSSNLGFSEGAGGLINLSCYPYSSDSGLNNFTNAMTLQLIGNGGLEMWCAVNGTDIYHNLFACYRPGYLHGAVTRNTNGLFFHYTPVFIGSDTVSEPSVDFQNLAIHPDMGDGLTWLLAVDGPALAKEFYVSTDWPDYVFDPNYKLMPLSEVEHFYKTNRHLPDIPSAKKMDTTGVPLGRTEAAITKQLEETLLYVTQLSHKIDALESEIQELKNEKEK